jgi:hypothetical protein
MRRRHGIWIVGLPAAVLAAAVAGVHASSAAPTHADDTVVTVSQVGLQAVEKA